MMHRVYDGLEQIDLAIQHCIEVAEKLENRVEYCNFRPTSDDYKKCMKCAAEHRQLAEWLTELRAYKLAKEAKDEL